MTQQEFKIILDKEIRTKVAELISKADFSNDKRKYIEFAWNELKETLDQFNFDNDTYNDLNLRYRELILTKIEKKYPTSM